MVQAGCKFMNAKLILFGPPQILYYGNLVDIRVRKAIALLAYLATTGQAHSRERLATLFWPESKDAVARTSLRQVIQALRATPLAGVLLTSRTKIELHPDVSSDVREFMNYTGDNACAQSAFSLETVTRLQAAEALYQGDFLQDFYISSSVEWEDWQSLRRIEFEYQASCVIAALTRYYAQHGLADSGLKMAARWLDIDPYNEEAHHLTMKLYILQHQGERALEQYHLLARILKREYDRAPDLQTQHTYELIRTGRFSNRVSQATYSQSKSIRTLLPKPLPTSAQDGETAAMIQQKLLNAAYQPQLIIVHDEDNQEAPGLIAALGHQDEIQAHFPDGILWAALHTTDDLEVVLRLWLDAMRVSILKSTSKLEHLAWQLHNGQRGKRLLFLLENASDVQHIRLLIPGYVGCALVVTTSDQTIAAALVDEADASFSVPIVEDRTARSHP